MFNHTSEMLLHTQSFNNYTETIHLRSKLKHIMKRHTFYNVFFGVTTLKIVRLLYIHFECSRCHEFSNKDDILPLCQSHLPVVKEADNIWVL